MLPKVELHVHLEGTMTPSLVAKLAQRNKIDIPTHIFGPQETFVWEDFLHFLKVYDIASAVLRTEEDYRDMTYDYLRSTAKQGAIYVEMMLSPDHAALCGLSYEQALAGCIRGIDDARKDFGIEGRLIITCVRHFGVDKCINVAKQAVMNPHPYVVGFGMGGDEINFPPKQFAPAYKIAAEDGLGCTAHAGEMQGADGVWEAITHLPITRVGHGVRSIEDAALIEALIERDIALEVCPGSNIALRVYPNFAAHPLRKLYDAGVKVNLSSDDPPYFATSIGREYELAKTHFAMTEHELLAITRQAIQASFADAATKEQLFQRVEKFSAID